jgi:hypothetical protein
MEIDVNRVETEYIRLRIGTGGSPLWTWYWTGGLHEMEGILLTAGSTVSFSGRTAPHS